jgi:NAD(P)-dependent dehydrogenase (short-subunit alcohol dehydrogenase family)
MKVLVTGGNRGLGKHLVEVFNGVSVSRTDGFDITKDYTAIANMSLEYDVFINNAFDGPPQMDWANFGQVHVLGAVYDLWSKNNKAGHIFNIGSVGEKTIVAREPEFETYRVAKAALAHASKQCTASFRANKVPFKTTLITLDRLDTDLSRSRSTWTGNGLQLSDISNFVNYATQSVNSNTCIEEITFYCNLRYEQNNTD